MVIFLYNIYIFIGIQYSCLTEKVPASVAQLDTHPSDNQVKGSIPTGSGKILFLEINYEIVSTVISLPSTDSRRAVVSFWRKNVYKYWLTT